MNYYFSDKVYFNVVDQMKIWSTIFGYEVFPNVKYTSPFREDSRPGCWVELKGEKYMFYDYASTIFNGLDIIEGMRYKFNLSYLEAVSKIYKIHIYNGKIITKAEYSNFKFNLFYKEGRYTKYDKEYWVKRGVTKKQLEEDGIEKVEVYKCNSKKNPTEFYYFYPDLAYAINYPSGNIKIVLPNNPVRFITNSNQEDLGGIWDDSDQIVISKSYKDYRQLKNSGFNTLFTMNEGCKPKILKDVCKNFKDVVIFYDNDPPGRECSKSLLEYIPNSREVYIPNKYGCKDPDELKVKYFNKCSKILKQIINGNR